MATVCLPVNGIGYGHLMRAGLASRWLRRAGERPVIFFQGKYPRDWELRTPGLSMLPLYRMPVEAAHLAVEQIARYARLSSPAVVIEDTYPAPVAWPADITRLLMLRPTAFAHLAETRATHGDGYARVLLCDHPDSPTWPYDAAQTAELASWDRWEWIGPVFRQASARAIAEVRRRYGLREHDQVFVFSMGGGGELPGSGDRAAFLQRAEAIAGELRRHAERPRLVFVRGPLFPSAVPLPVGFEGVDHEPELPALLAAANGAVIRPGFNATWECIAGRTPFVAAVGTTYQEPVNERLTRLRARGLDLESGPASWFDPEWRRRFVAACDGVLERHDGAPARAFVHAYHRCMPAAGRATPANPRRASEPEAFVELSRSIAQVPGPKPLLIRIDDIVERNEVLSWAVGVCRSHQLPLSVEVIPYFARITGTDLDALDADGLCEVSQHGFAHLPSGIPGRSRGEFCADRARPSAAAAALLRRGRRLLRFKFGDRFAGGYSAPYDTWPQWLAAEWIESGGRFVSWMSGNPARGRVPSVKLPLDPWDWATNTHRTAQDVADQALKDLRADGSVGLVLHPQCLQSSEHRAAFEQLVIALLRGGCAGAPMSGASHLHK